MQLPRCFGWLTGCCAMCLLGLVARGLHAFCTLVLLIVCFGMLSGSCYVFARVSCVVMLLDVLVGCQGEMFGY